MNGDLLLDTNIVIALFAGDEQVTTRLREAREVFVPSIVIGELNYGARKSGRSRENLDRVNSFASGSAVLACDVVTASYYGEVKASLQQKGKPIPENDIWIAALALQHELVLVSRDDHFDWVGNLKKVAW